MPLGASTPSLTYVRRFHLKESLRDAEVATFWRWAVEEALPTLRKISETRSVKMYSCAGGLRGDLRLIWEMDGAKIYEKALHDLNSRTIIGVFYSRIDLKTSSLTFLQEITPELIEILAPQ